MEFYKINNILALIALTLIFTGNIQEYLQFSRALRILYLDTTQGHKKY